MNADDLNSPFLPFGPKADREYGSIQLHHDGDLPGELPFRYSRFVVAPGNTSRLDQHEVLEVWVVLSGNGTLRVGGIESRVTAGDVVHFRPMRSHQVTNDGPGNLEVFSFWWKG